LLINQVAQPRAKESTFHHYHNNPDGITQEVLFAAFAVPKRLLISLPLGKPTPGMMLGAAKTNLLLLFVSSRLLTLGAATPESQQPLGPAHPKGPHSHAVDPAILAALEAHPDPVDAYLSLKPEAAAELAAPRLLHVAGEEAPRWMTEGDKMRLRRERKKFTDITDHEEFYAQYVGAETSGDARM
jgi:leucyl aminopeptidase